MSRVRGPAGSDPDDVRRERPRLTGDGVTADLRPVDAVRGPAQEEGVLPAPSAPAPVLGCGGDVVPLAGTERRGHREQDVGALVVELPAGDPARPERIAPRDVAVGRRTRSRTGGCDSPERAA